MATNLAQRAEVETLRRLRRKIGLTDEEQANFYLAKARKGRKPEGSGHDRTGCMQCRKHKQGKD